MPMRRARSYLHRTARNIKQRSVASFVEHVHILTHMHRERDTVVEGWIQAGGAFTAARILRVSARVGELFRARARLYVPGGCNDRAGRFIAMRFYLC